MDITHVRVDNRLVHGQILEAWIPYLRASCIIVVDDHVASDYFCESVIRMAVPREVEVIICRLKEFAETYSFHQGSGQKTIVLFSKIADALTVYRLGFRFDRLNIGNVYNEECCLRCTASVLLSDGDVRDLATLRAEGVQIDLQPVPREKPVDYLDIVQATQS
ncbi:MAG: PTS system mannose/fructose/N-acetylgalactosamine-transporter subunit IIB [Syntrophales bacterium]